MSVPAAAVAGSVFTIERSATGWAVVVAMEALLAALVSSAGSAAATVDALALHDALPILMWTTMVKVWVALGARVPKVQVTVPAALVQPALAETKLTCGGAPACTAVTWQAGVPSSASVRV